MSDEYQSIKCIPPLMARSSFKDSFLEKLKKKKQYLLEIITLHNFEIS